MITADYLQTNCALGSNVIVCPFCKSEVDSSNHVLLLCSSYDYVYNCSIGNVILGLDCIGELLKSINGRTEFWLLLSD